MEAIFNRRSIRAYRDEEIADETVTTLLRAAMRAPSAINGQPWEFIVLRSRDTMLKIIDFHPYAHMLRQAKCAIVVCGNQLHRDLPVEFLIQDCSAATQNLLLEAVHLGLGAVWLGVYPREERIVGLQRLLDLPDSVVPITLVSLGYPAENLPPLDTFRPDRIHYERWGGEQAPK